MRTVPSIETIKKETRKFMRELGVYKPQYTRTINVYADLVHQYHFFMKKFEENGFEIEAETDRGGTKKTPQLVMLENLRKDILAYSDRLCLNPKVFNGITVEDKKVGTLAKLLGDSHD